MATPWDASLKILISENPQAFADLVLRGTGVRVIGKRLTEFEGRKIVADALLEAVLNEQEILLEIEFQSENDEHMAERLLEYNLRARREHGRPVYSCVIYLRDGGEVPKSPLRWTLSNGLEILQFHFLSIELAKLSPEDLLELGHPGLLPLVVLTRGGARREIVDQVFTGLQASGETRLLPVGYTLASLVFGKENAEDQEWLHRRYMRMQDIMKEAPIYEVMTRDAREEGLQKGRQEGLLEGRQEGLLEGRQEGLEALRRAVLEIIHARFPKKERLAKKLIAFVDDPLKLQQLIVQISLAQNAEQVTQYLIELDEEEK